MSNEIEKALEAGYAILIYPNQLGTTTVALINGVDWFVMQDNVEDVPEDHVVDVVRPLTDNTLADSVAQVIRKINREGEYADWDDKMRELGLED